jgi:ribonuclease HI
MEVKHWTHPANCVKIIEGQEDSKHAIHVHTDGSKCEYGVGSGVAILSDSNLIDTLKYKLNGRCSNNQAKQLVILKALENLQHLETNERSVSTIR